MEITTDGGPFMNLVYMILAYIGAATLVALFIAANWDMVKTLSLRFISKLHRWLS